MNLLIKKQLENYFITQELFTKLLQKRVTSPARIHSTVTFSFADVKLIRNLISVEIITGMRPKVRAFYLKKDLLINLKAILPLELTSYLQMSPVIWSDTLNASSKISGSYFSSLVLVKSGLKLTSTRNFSLNSANKLDLLIKSAYLD